MARAPEASPGAGCYHCGLPLGAPGSVVAGDIGGQVKQFCCFGCKAVCQTIVAGGFSDYYRNREGGEELDEAALQQAVRFAELADIQTASPSENQAAGRKVRLLIENIHCAACVWLIEHFLRQQDGIITATVDGAARDAWIEWDPAVTNLAGVVRGIASIGYIAYPYDRQRSEKLDHKRRQRSTPRILFAGFCAFLVMHFSMASYLMGGPDEHGNLPGWEIYGHWVSLLLSSLALVYSGSEFFSSALSALRNLRLNMDVPISVGLCAAFAGSLYGMSQGSATVYFDCITMLVFLVLLSRRLELAGRMRAASSRDRLRAQRPSVVQVINGNHIDDRLAAEVNPGEMIRIARGAMIPLDGVLESEFTRVDESLITGESEVLSRQRGARLMAGSINCHHAIDLRVEQREEHGTLNRIDQLMRGSLGKKPALEALADRIVPYLVAVVLTTAALTAVAGYLAENPDWLANSIAVLVITCPCALALATPVAYALVNRELLSLGILPLNPSALEAAARFDTVVWDKTGTLTGNLRVQDVEPKGDLGADECIQLAASLTRSSSHPVASALATAAGSDFTPAEFESLSEETGAGLCARLNGQLWRLGNSSHVLGRNDSSGTESAVRERQEQKLLLANESGVVAEFTLSEALHPEARSVVSKLGESGVDRQLILSGDNENKTRAIAARLGINEYFSGLKPDGKLQHLLGLQDHGGTVLAVGEGINDAPLLAAANISIAVGDASDMSKFASDFVILNGRLEGVTRLRRLARRSIGIIRQNLIWALSYNGLGIPLAAFGFVPPWLAALGMSASSLIVIGNSLRIGSQAGKAREAGNHSHRPPARLNSYSGSA